MDIGAGWEFFYSNLESLKSELKKEPILVLEKMASVGIAPIPGARDSTGVDKLPEEMNDMKIRDDKVGFDAIFVL